MARRILTASLIRLALAALLLAIAASRASAETTVVAPLGTGPVTCEWRIDAVTRDAHIWAIQALWAGDGTGFTYGLYRVTSLATCDDWRGIAT